jgi:hypothetical protein
VHTATQTTACCASQIVFGGYYVNADNVPKLLKWLPKV